MFLIRKKLIQKSAGQFKSVVTGGLSMNDKQQEDKWGARFNFELPTSNFDLDAAYNDEYRFSLQELYRVVAEIYNGTKDEKNEYSSYFSHYQPDKKTIGIINKLEMYHFLDVCPKKTDTRQEVFDKLKLLKFIFDVEKTKTHAQKALSELPDKKIRILNFMLNPELSQINNSFQSQEHPQPSDIDAVQEALKPYVERPNVIEKEIAVIHQMWMCLFLRINNEVIKGVYDENYLDTILHRLETILDTIKHPGLQKSTEGTLNTFYQIVIYDVRRSIGIP